MLSSRTPVALRTQGNSTTAGIAMVKAQGWPSASWNPRTIVPVYELWTSTLASEPPKKRPSPKLKRDVPTLRIAFHKPTFLVPASSQPPETHSNN